MHPDKEFVASSAEYSELADSIETIGPAAVSNRWRTTTVFLIKLCIGAAIVMWLLKSGRLDIAAYKSLLHSSSLLLLAGIALAQIVSLTIILARWWILLRAQRINVPLVDTLILGYRGTFLSLFVPGALGTDGLRVLHLSRHCRTRFGAGLASIVLDRFVGFVGLVILSAFFCCLLSRQHSGGAIGDFVPWVLTVLAGTIAIIATACGLLSVGRFVFLDEFKWARAIRNSFVAYREHPTVLVQAAAMTIVAHLFVSIGACLGLVAMNINFSWLVVFAITPLITFIRFIPLTPLGLGVADVASEELYTLLGISGGAENQMLGRFIWIVVLLVCGLAFLRRLPGYASAPLDKAAPP